MDNASPDGSGAKLRECVPEGEFLQLRKNTGYAGGNNIGMKLAVAADADYVFILNPDIRLEEKTISECVKASLRNPNFGAFNPIQVREGGDKIDEKFFRSVMQPIGLQDTVLKEGTLQGVFEVKELLGAAFFLATKSIRRVGGFDPLYFAYGEETDLCRRLRYHGIRLGLVGNARVEHLRTKESAGVMDRVLFLRLKGMYLNELKDPRRSFRRSVRLVFRQFLDDIRGRRYDQYPFSNYPITHWHAIRAFFWVLMRLPAIRQHRRLEVVGRAHV